MDPQQKAVYDHQLRSVQPEPELQSRVAGGDEGFAEEPEFDLRSNASSATVLWLMLAIAAVLFLLMLFGWMR